MINEYKLIVNENGLPMLFINNTFDETKHLVRTSEIVDFINKQYKLNICVQEHVYLFCFNDNQDVLGVFEISRGSNTKALIPIKEILISVLLTGANNVILIHNHPNGNPNFSYEDINITNRLKFALSQIEVDLLDHILISQDLYSSMLNENII